MDEKKDVRQWKVSFVLQVNDTEDDGLFDNEVEDGFYQNLVNAYLLFQAQHAQSTISISDPGINIEYVDKPVKSKKPTKSKKDKTSYLKSDKAKSV